MDFFRKEALDTLETNVQKLTRNQIDSLEKFDEVLHHSRRLKRRVKKIIKQWHKLESVPQRTAIIQAGEGGRSLVRAEVEQDLYAQDPELYNIKGVQESIAYLNGHPDLSPDRVQKIVDHTLNYVLFSSNWH